MMVSQSEPIRFKFKWVDEHGNETGFVKKKGSFDGETLTLDETVVPADSIADLAIRENRMVLSLPTQEGELFAPVIAIFGTDVDKLKQAVNTSRSDMLALKEKQRLQDKGKSSSYRDQICPYCAATIILSDMPNTPQVYCEYCDTLFTTATTSYETSFEKSFRLCEECGMYSHPKKFTVFYFYFLVVISGWYSNATVRCPACMRPEAWKMLFGNIFGLIGLPVALVQLIRSYSGRAGRGPLKGLDDANIQANKGHVDRALSQYDTVMDNVPINAGVKYNVAIGLVKKKEYQHAEAMYQMALDDCANYWPAVRGMIHVLQLQDKPKEIERFLRIHGLDPDDQPADLTEVLNPPEE